MQHTPLPFDPQLARQVKADILEPQHHKTAIDFETACDFYQRHMLKHPFLSDFHCYAEYLHGGLLEGDRHVISYVPQCLHLYVRRKLYTPDCYVASDQGRRQVVEIKPDGEMPEDMQIPLTHFLAQYNMEFVVKSNESILERQMEAENWHEIVRILRQAQDLTTTEAEQTVLEELAQTGPCTLGDLIDPGDRERTYVQEIAVFRLLHQGHLVAELTDQPLDYDTGISLCASAGEND